VGPTDQLIGVLGNVMRELFLRSSRIHPTLLGQHERLPCIACHKSVYDMCIRFLLHDVHRSKSP
jgi:hypothetical protein